MNETDILFQIGDYWVSHGKFANQSKGFVVWENNLTHSKLVASIGFEGEYGLERARVEATRREFREGINKEYMP